MFIPQTPRLPLRDLLQIKDDEILAYLKVSGIRFVDKGGERE